MAFLFLLLFQLAISFAQKPDWGPWTSVACYKGIQYSIMNVGFNKNTNSYWWNIRWKNNYSKPVSFDGEVIIGGESSIRGGWGSLQPQGTQTYTSVPYKSGSTNFIVRVTKVCFADKYGGCSDNIEGYPNYAECDNGTPNYKINGKKTSGTPQNNPSVSIAPSNKTNNPDQYNNSRQQLENDRNRVNAESQQRQQAQLQLQAQILQQQLLKQQQEQQRQQQLQQGMQQLATGITDLFASIQANKERKRQEAIAQQQAKQAKALAENQEEIDAYNGDFAAQRKVANRYFEQSKYGKAEYFYSLAVQNSSSQNRTVYFSNYLTSLALQGKKNNVFEVLKYLQSNKIENSEVNIAEAFLKIYCHDFSIGYLECDDKTILEGINLIKKYTSSNKVKALLAYMQVTGAYEKYGVPANETEGMKILENMAEKSYPKHNALYYLGMVYLNGTNTIKKNENKALKYFMNALSQKEKELHLVPNFSSDETNAYFNNKLLAYIKTAEIYSRKSGKSDQELGETMFKKFYIWYAYMIPQSDISYFKGFNVPETKGATINFMNVNAPNNTPNADVNPNVDYMEQSNIEGAKNTDEGYRAAINLLIPHVAELDGDAINNLGFYYWKLKDYQKSTKFFKMSALKESNHGIRNLANAYTRGEGIEVDKKMAYVYYLKIKPDFENIAGVYHQIAHLCEGGYNNDGNQPDYQNAYNYFLKGANLGEANCMLHIGEYYDANGKLQTDLNLAKQWYQKACNAGQSDACELLKKL
eukprot:gene11797-13757_t